MACSAAILGINICNSVFINGIYKVARVAGPEHNLLGLQFSGDSKELKIFELAANKPKVRRVSGESVFEQIQAGVAEVSVELPKQYAVSQAYFTTSDTPSVGVYKYLDIESIRIDHNNGDFKGV